MCYSLRRLCVFLKPLGPIPRSSVRWSPRSGHGSGLYWHPAVGCGDLPSPCEWADASQAIIPMACKAERARGHRARTVTRVTSVEATSMPFM